MRVFFFGLLLANIALLGWQMTGHSLSQEPDFVAVDQGVEPLVLVNEPDSIEAGDSSVSAQQTPAVDTSVADQPVQAGETSYCYALSGFEDMYDARVARTGLEALGYEVEIKTRYPQGDARYLVYLPPAASLAAAEKTVDELRSRGIRDYQIMTIGGRKNAISLGVFSQREIAENRIREITDMGYDPMLTTVSGGKMSHRLLFHKPGNAPLSDDERGFLLRSFKQADISQIECAG